MRKISKIANIAGLLVIAISTSACVSSNKASQNQITQQQPFVMPELSSEKRALQNEKASQLKISQNGAMQIMDSQFVSSALAPDSAAAVAAGYNITKISVVVPKELTVSEANVYVPNSDIVWREDPFGDRKAQVQKILHDAIKEGTASLNNGRDVILTARVKMFHALSEKARYTVGGRHNINFDYVLLDAQTGQPVSDVKTVDLKFHAFGGRRADAAMQRGETQKVRITQHVAEAIYEQLASSSAI